MPISIPTITDSNITIIDHHRLSIPTITIARTAGPRPRSGVRALCRGVKREDAGQQQLPSHHDHAGG
jgi:hypothetical protein